MVTVVHRNERPRRCDTVREQADTGGNAPIHVQSDSARLRGPVARDGAAPPLHFRTEREAARSRRMVAARERAEAAARAIAENEAREHAGAALAVNLDVRKPLTRLRYDQNLRR